MGHLTHLHEITLHRSANFRYFAFKSSKLFQSYSKQLEFYQYFYYRRDLSNGHIFILHNQLSKCPELCKVSILCGITLVDQWRQRLSSR